MMSAAAIRSARSSATRRWVISRVRETAAGFTLVELMVGIALSVGVVSASFLCLRAGFDAQAIVDERGELIQKARVALEIMSADLRSACPLHPDFEFVGLDRSAGDREEDTVVFATHHYRPERPGESDFCEVTYLVNVHAETKTRGLWRRRDPSPDLNPFDGGSREELIPGVEGLSLEYYDGFRWYERWGRTQKEISSGYESSDPLAFNLSGLPEAVRITLALAPPGDANEKRTDLFVISTVVRLELAGRAMSSMLSGSSTSTTGEDSETETQPGGGENATQP